MTLSAAYQENYEKFLSRIEHMIYHGATLKLATFKYFDEQLVQDFNSSVKAFPLLPLIRDSLQIDCVMTLSKLVEGTRSDKTIQKFINYTEANHKHIRWKKSITHKDISQQRQLLQNIQDQIDNLLTQRDKYFAHADKEYFFEPGKLSADYPSAYSEMVLILSTVQKIISEHSEWVNGSMKIDMSGFAYAHAEKTLNFLKTASLEWHKKYRP